MTKRKIITLAILAFVIAGALVALSIITSLDNTSDELSPEPIERIFILGDQLYTQPPSALTIEVQNAYGTFTIVNTNPDELPHHFTVQDLECFNLRSSRLAHAGSSVRSMPALEILFYEGANLSELGLLDPVATVSINYLDGTSATLLIGETAPGGAGVYAMREGAPTVYLLSTSVSNYFMFRDLDFVETQLTETFDILPDISKAVLGGSVRPDYIVIERAPPTPGPAPILTNSHVIVYPRQSRLHCVRGLEPIFYSYGLWANRVEAKFESIDELSQWGLDDPYSTLEVISVTHDSFKLIATQPNEEGYVYLLRDGLPFVFSINSQQLPWLELTYFEMMDHILILPQIDTVSHIEIHLPNRKINITLEGEGQDLKIFVDGVPYEAQQGVDPVRNFRTLYMDFLLTRYESIPENPMPPNSPILLQFTYNYRDGRPSDTVTIYEGAARRVFVQLNDETPMFGLSSFVDHLLRSIESFLAGEEVIGYS